MRAVAFSPPSTMVDPIVPSLHNNEILYADFAVTGARRVNRPRLGAPLPPPVQQPAEAQIGQVVDHAGKSGCRPLLLCVGIDWQPWPGRGRGRIPPNLATCTPATRRAHHNALRSLHLERVSWLEFVASLGRASVGRRLMWRRRSRRVADDDPNRRAECKVRVRVGNHVLPMLLVVLRDFYLTSIERSHWRQSSLSS